MEDWWENWFSDLDMNGDNSFNQCQTNSIVNIEEHQKQQPTLYCETKTQIHSLYSSCLEDIGFKGQSSNVVCLGKGNNNCGQLVNCHPHMSSSKRTLSFEGKASRGPKRVKNSSETHDHIMSERKRRHEMAERFIALSAIIPGLKKIDKASVLREAVNYVKQLQERIAVLEEESNIKSSSKSMIFVKKSQSHPRSASCEINCLGSNQELPEVDAIGIESVKELLIRIHCEKRKGILLKLMAQLENMHLSIVSSSVLLFGKSALNITIVAQMGEEYSLTEGELVENLRQDLLKLYDMQL